MQSQPVQPVELTYAEPATNRNTSALRRRLVLAGVALLVLTIELGIVLSNSNDRLYTTPVWIKILIGASLTIATVAIIALLIFVFERKVLSIIGAILLTVIIFAVAGLVYMVSPLSAKSTITGLEPPEIIALRDFAGIVIPAWLATLIAAGVALSIRRDRMQFLLLAGALVTGLISAGLDAAYFLFFDKPIFRDFEWSRLASSGFLLAVALCMVALLARAFNSIKSRPAAAPQTSFTPSRL
jgi:hypothetical protein